MSRRIIVTAGAIVRDNIDRILLQRRSDYGDWGLPGGGMEPGETIEETMKRELHEETGLLVKDYELYSIYSGPRMEYVYPDGNEVVFVMFLFNVCTDLTERVSLDGKSLIYVDKNNESLQLQFVDLKDIELDQINKVQKPIFEDLKINNLKLLRT